MIFQLPLVEKRVKPHQVTTLHLLAALAFTGSGAVLWLFYTPAVVWGMALFLFGIALLGATMFRNKWLIAPGTNRIVRIIELALLLTLTALTIIQNWTPATFMFGVLAVSNIFALLWEKQDNNSLYVVIDGNGIKLPFTARKRQINWQDVERVILKYGILTVDCVDNRLFQWNIGTLQVDSTAFDSYCHQQIEAGKEKRDKNDW